MSVWNHQNQTHLMLDRKSRGFTLVEALIATVVMAVLLGALMTTFSQSQKLFTSQHDLVELSQVGRITMNQIQSFLRQAGNDPNDIGLTPITIDNPNQCTINSDVTGAVPDPGGDPMYATGEADGTLANLYEQVTIRYAPDDDQLFINVGGGEQLLAEDMPLFELTFYDLQGNTTTDGNQIARVHIKMVVETSNSDMETGKVRTMTFESDVMVRTRAHRFFSYEADQNYVTS